MACVEVSSGARPRENGLTSTQVCGKDQLGQPWKKELNFFPFSGLHRTLVRKLNLVLMERERRSNPRPQLWEPIKRWYPRLDEDPARPEPLDTIPRRCRQVTDAQE